MNPSFIKKAIRPINPVNISSIKPVKKSAKFQFLK